MATDKPLSERELSKLVPLRPMKQSHARLYLVGMSIVLIGGGVLAARYFHSVSAVPHTGEYTELQKKQILNNLGSDGTADATTATNVTTSLESTNESIPDDMKSTITENLGS